MLKALSGRKTYLVSAALIVYAITAVYLGKMGTEEALLVVLNGLGLGALRAGMNK